MRHLCLHAQVEKTVHGNRVMRVTRNYVIGALEAFDEFFAESCDSKKVNTSYIERLNLFRRNSCAALRRKTSCAAKVADALLGRIEISRLY
jgi:IS1 family transposase